MDVTIYGLPTCEVCKDLLKRLDEKEINYFYIDNMDEVLDMARKLNIISIPIIELNGELVSLQKFESEIFD